jgi:hypothetical protein
MNKKAIVDETVEYYETHKRGLDYDLNSCVYHNEDGDMCAVGRCLIDPPSANYTDTMDISELIEFMEAENLDEILKVEYRGHTQDFWEELQLLHDCKPHWNENNKGGQVLSEMGKVKRGAINTFL